MATRIYRCPATLSIHVTSAYFARVRPNELFAIDSGDSATIADILAQGLDVSGLTQVTSNVSFADPSHAHAHNPFLLED